MKVAMLGLGAISKYYVADEGNAPFGQWVWCDVDAGKASWAEARGVEFSARPSDVLSRPDVTAVILNLPNHLHFEMARAALEQGKHVCCEKPLALRVEQAQQLRALADRSGLALFTAFHRRYNANVIELKRALEPDSARHVRVRYWERIEEHCGEDAWYLDAARCGGGCVADNGPNALDTIHYLLGSQLHVRGCWLARGARGVDVRALLWGEADCGTSFSVELDWGYPGEVKDVSVELDDGRHLHADMLRGFDGFKSSLWHEYRAVLAEFALACSEGFNAQREYGSNVVRWIADAYALAREDATLAFAPPPRLEAP